MTRAVEMTDAEIAVYIRTSAYLERLAQLERRLQESDRMLDASKIADILHLPLKAVQSAMVGMAAQMTFEAGGDVLFIDPPPSVKN